MNKHLKLVLLTIFNLVHPVIKPWWIQKILRKLGFKFPYYLFAKKLEYYGIVDFVINGKKLFLKSNNQPLEMFVFWYGIFGYWETTQLRLWAKLVNQFNVIIDVGANIGIYSIVALINEKAKIHAFEPVPYVRNQLLENISLNKTDRINVVPKIVGETCGEETIYVPRKGWVDVASINKEFAEQFTKEGEMYDLRVEMTSLDRFVDGLNLKGDDIVLCKIDVEGAEKRVLMGMSDLLTRKHMVFSVELLDETYFNEVINLLPNGYFIYAIDEMRCEVYSTNNFVPAATNYLISCIDFGKVIDL